MTTITSIKCQGCQAGERYNDFWEVVGDTATCTNCGYEREFIRRNGQSGEMTPSQRKKIEKIRNWFKDYFRKDELTTFEVTYQDETGFVYVSVETTDHILTSDGGHFCIGRRGGLKVLGAYGLSKVHDEEFYARNLGGKVGW